MRMGEFREQYLNGTLETFDAVFTYSSLEHSGQGEVFSGFGHVFHFLVATVMFQFLVATVMFQF